jgi:hypothetical protein
LRRILITGHTGLAEALANVYSNELVTCVSKSTGHDINHINNWGVDYLEYDCVFNCAYDGIGQQLVLEYFYHHWHTNIDKKLITIGSKIITQPRLDQDRDREYWPYRTHKQTLQAMFNCMVTNAKCDLKIVNPGAIDTPMIQHQSIPKMSTEFLAAKIYNFVEDRTTKRLDIWL